MNTPPEYSFIRYLQAKKSVEDRSLNRHVRDWLVSHLNSFGRETPLHILEIGAGTGTMLARFLEWELLDQADFTAIDMEATNILFASQELPKLAADLGFVVQALPDDGFTLERSGKKVHILLKTVELTEFLIQERTRSTWDLIIANAFLDLVDVPSILPPLLRLLADDGLFYFTINFDGITILEPPILDEFDSLILALYHRTMDERTVNGSPAGDSLTGRRLFNHIRQAGGRMLEAGSSDWVVFPEPNGYRGDEAFFLHFLINTIFEALQDHPELDQARFEAWIDERHSQIERGELVLITHQLDFLGGRERKI
jgi:SAM-dependent methyltransferase